MSQHFSLRCIQIIIAGQMQNRVVFLKYHRNNKIHLRVAALLHLEASNFTLYFWKWHGYHDFASSEHVKPGKLWCISFVVLVLISPQPLRNYFSVAEFQFALFNVKGCTLIGQRKFGLLKCLFFTGEKCKEHDTIIFILHMGRIYSSTPYVLLMKYQSQSSCHSPNCSYLTHSGLQIPQK